MRLGIEAPKNPPRSKYLYACADNFRNFANTFAVELLLSGVPIDQVSLLLGHSSVKVTEKHYRHS